MRWDKIPVNCHKCGKAFFIEAYPPGHQFRPPEADLTAMKQSAVCVSCLKTGVTA